MAMHDDDREGAYPTEPIRGEQPTAVQQWFVPPAADAGSDADSPPNESDRRVDDWYVAGAGAPIHDDTIGVSPGGPGGRKDQSGLGAKIIIGAAAVALLAGGAGGAAGYMLADSQSSVVASPVVTGGGTSAPVDGTIAAVATAVGPSVVNISTGSGQGSGFIIRSDGYILTNNHVVDGAGTVEVTFEDGSTASAQVVGANPGYDLAVIKADKTGLPVTSLGSSADVKVGDTAIAIGSPLGLQGTVTSGIVSALDRPVTAGGSGETAFINAIQTDAAVNPGNSGGPLVDGEGKVIGVNSAIASLGAGAGAQAGSIGLGFAIPIDTANRIAEELINTGSSQTPVIGAQIDNSYSGPGVRVGEVTAGGPADSAGVQSGDVITAVDGRNVADYTELVVAIRDKGVGQPVTLTVDRSGGEQEITVTLGASQ